jgi:hypothetical protein
MAYPIEPASVINCAHVPGFSTEPIMCIQILSIYCLYLYDVVKAQAISQSMYLGRLI